MRRRNWLLMTTGLFLLSLVISAQGPQTNPPPSPQVNQDRIEAAHGKLLSGEDRAKDASRLTEAVAPALPASAASTAPIPRKNIIDEHIFGRMERDKIPHAPLAGDDEFLRRAYLDATGLLPTPDQVRSFLNDRDPNKLCFPRPEQFAEVICPLVGKFLGADESIDQLVAFIGIPVVQKRTNLIRRRQKAGCIQVRPSQEFVISCQGLVWNLVALHPPKD